MRWSGISLELHQIPHKPWHPSRFSVRTPSVRDRRSDPFLLCPARENYSALFTGRHDQDPDPVSSRIRPGAAATGGPRHQCGAASAVLHPWLRERLSEILAALPPAGSSQDPAATQVAWAVWQAGLTRPFTL